MRWTVVVALCAAACGGVDEAGSVADEDLTAGAPHVLQLHVAATQAPAAKLTWYGGPVVASARVVAVLWGPAVEGDVAGRIGDFYGAVAGSAYLGWLSEYDTSKQKIGRGSVEGVYRIAPAQKATSLTDAQIAKELAAQIRKGALPPASTNTIYMVHFPPGVRITLDGSHSCEAGGFCGYHSAFRSGRNHVRYAVLPDMGKGSGCESACGGTTPFSAVTSVASHELVEAITDPDVGLARGLGAPLAWYDASNGEIGDICAGHEGKLRAGGASWTVQKQWSNAARACVLSRP